MEQEVKIDPVDQSGAASGATKEDKVSYDSFRKSVEAEKNARKRAQELEQRVQDFERKEMEAKGQYEKLVQQLKEENDRLKTDVKKERETYLWERVTTGIKTEAAKAGCQSPDKLIKLLDKNDFETLQADADGYNLKQESLSALIEKAKKENSFLFSAPSVKIADASPSSRVQTQVSKSLDQMSKEEILAQLRNS
jgi:predicted RNase H-like nuclease (RuvC/YqgF family)